MVDSLIYVKKGDDATSKFVADPAGYLGVEGIEVKAAENTADTINLALPYYADLQKSAGKKLSDNDLEAASGGAGDIPGNNDAVRQLIDGIAHLGNLVIWDMVDMYGDAGWVDKDKASDRATKYVGKRRG